MCKHVVLSYCIGIRPVIINYTYGQEIFNIIAETKSLTIFVRIAIKVAKNKLVVINRKKEKMYICNTAPIGITKNQARVSDTRFYASRRRLFCKWFLRI